MKIAILQPIIPHYREVFFKRLNKVFDVDLFIYKNQNDIKKNNFQNANLSYSQLNSFQFFGALFYNFFPLVNPKYKMLILPGEIRSLSTWILLFLGKFTSKKIILWGHGISIKNYIEEEKKLLPIRVVFHKLADYIWLYTEKEKEIWSKYIDKKKITALNNTIDIESIVNLPKLDKKLMKQKYKVHTKLNLIYCARFTANRRIDLMLKLIKVVENEDIGFIIIGEGDHKPDFSMYKNVYDFGSVYDLKKKNELFSIADMYFQPAWTGLSIVEAMAFSKPVLTFERSQNVLQCVEYSYITNNKNGYIFKDVEELVDFIQTVSSSEIEQLQATAKKYAISSLSINSMMNHAEKELRKYMLEYE